MLHRGEAHGYNLLNGLDEFGFNPGQKDPSLIYRALREMDTPTTTVLFPLQATITDTSESYCLYYGNWRADPPPVWETEESGTPEATINLGGEETPVVSTTIDASATEPQSLVSADGQVTITFPPGSITTTVVVTQTPYRAIPSHGSHFLTRFDLTATTLGGQPVTRPQLTVANQEPDLVNDHL